MYREGYWNMPIVDIVKNHLHFLEICFNGPTLKKAIDITTKFKEKWPSLV